MKTIKKLKKFKDSSILNWILYILSLCGFYLFYNSNSFVLGFLKNIEYVPKMIIFFIGYIITSFFGRYIFYKGWKKLSNPKEYKPINIIADYIMIAEIFVILYSFAILINKSYENFDLDIVITVFHIIYIIWIFVSIVKNMLNNNYLEVIQSVALFYLLGIISLGNWTMIVAIINIFTFLLDYDKYMIFKNYLESDEEDDKKEDVQKVKEKLTFMKLDSFFITLLIYVFILITDRIDISSRLYIYFNNLDSLPNVVVTLFKGLDKLIIGLIIFLIYKKFLYKNIRKYKEKFIKFIVDKIDNYKV